MYKFLPYMTNDKAVGLFNNNVFDVYHSAFGAITEAYEKFVNPLLDLDILNNKSKVNVLDICYGIGYNSKAFINQIIEKKIKSKINIDCVDSDEILMQISPFITNEINFFYRFFFRKYLYKNIFDYETAKKIVLKNSNVKSKYKICKIVNKIILYNIINHYGHKFITGPSKKILHDYKNFPYLYNIMIIFYEFLRFLCIFIPKKSFLSTFVHNIYYGNISKRYDNLFKQFNLNFYPKDIRLFVKESPLLYDIVFLDGFTPSKCPCMWSVDFFKELRKHLSDNGVIVTYNTSAPVRNALKLSGFYIGNSYDTQKKIVGTIATLNKDLIKKKLSDKQNALLNTKAGIPYRDFNLELNNDIIILNRKSEVLNSNLITSSKFFKDYKNEI